MPVARKLKEALLEKAANSAKNTTSDAPATPSADSASTADLNTSPRSSVIPKQIASLDEMSSSAEDKPSLTPLSMIPGPDLQHHLGQTVHRDFAQETTRINLHRQIADLPLHHTPQIHCVKIHASVV